MGVSPWISIIFPVILVASATVFFASFLYCLFAALDILSSNTSRKVRIVAKIIGTIVGIPLLGSLMLIAMAAPVAVLIFVFLEFILFSVVVFLKKFSTVRIIAIFLALLLPIAACEYGYVANKTRQETKQAIQGQLSVLDCNESSKKIVGDRLHRADYLNFCNYCKKDSDQRFCAAQLMGDVRYCRSLDAYNKDQCLFGAVKYGGAPISTCNEIAQDSRASDCRYFVRNFAQ